MSSLSTLHPHFREKKDADRLNEFISYLTRASFRSSWGLSALEGIVNSQDDDVAENSHIPSMVFYGVDRKEAIAVRMLGVPRSIAAGLSQIVFDKKKPQSYNDVRKRVSELSIRDWESIAPQNSSLNGEEWKSITDILLR